MPHVDRHLGSEERLVFRTRLHPVIFGGAASFAAFAILAVGLVIRHNDLPSSTNWLLALVGAGIAILSLLPPALRWRTSEFTVTSRRVLIKVGLVSVHTLELTLPKVEDIKVDQTVAGRLLDYGTVRITGVGGTLESFPLVAAPTALRDAVLREAHAASGR